MRIILSFLLFCQIGVFATVTDYDCIVVGTSPFSMLEALYQHYSGKRVLMIDEADTYGGAWKSINICGIAHADMGCHEIGCQQEIKEFLQDYVGCKLLSLDNPHQLYQEPAPPYSKGFYPSEGCYELIGNLKKLVKAANLDVLLQHRINSIRLDGDTGIAEVKAQDRCFTTPKIIVTPCSKLYVENFPDAELNKNPCANKHFHLYLLVEDPSIPRFTYEDSIVEGASRGANLTWYLGLEGTGMQLIVIQARDEKNLAHGEGYLEALKEKKYLDPTARILRMETYIYEQCHINPTSIEELGTTAQSIFDIMDTWNLGRMCDYIGKWKEVLRPFNEIVHD
ncbi:MAG TPA: hypothetical protein VLG49_07720 [Rhabdochlamydiaceae bacterium]|nr:hypothetical protein [Rhabdochlamydiaceae bacterium]